MSCLCMWRRRLCWFVCPQRKQMLEAQKAKLNTRIAELEQAQNVAESSMAPLQEQIDSLQKQKQELQADTHKQVQA